MTRARPRTPARSASASNRPYWLTSWVITPYGPSSITACASTLTVRAPEVVLGFIAGRTQRLRLGHGITLTPHRYNHPIRVAERVATLDILSAGRVDWGSGKSSSRVEQDAFEIDRNELEGQWQEALSMIPHVAIGSIRMGRQVLSHTTDGDHPQTRATAAPAGVCCLFTSGNGGSRRPIGVGFAELHIR